MTKQELEKAFIAECSQADKDAGLVVKGSPAEIVAWIADKFCKSDTNDKVLFSGAFTGMKDKHGRPIHEGDTVRLYYKGEYVECTVIYDLKHAAFFIKWPDGYVNQYFMNPGNYEIVEAKV
jgi:hypothetical protein